MATAAIILAAGKSKRLKTQLPKSLHEVCGRPMLEYVLRACYEAGCQRIMMVVGHGKDEIIHHFGHDKRIQWIEQTEQLGTGHAARMCEEELRKQDGDVFILAGDGPLIRAQVLQALQKAHVEQGAAASMATAILDDPTGYGRILRDNAGEFIRIIEQADATPQQREIHEVFPSYYCVRVGELLTALAQLRPNNQQGEYYLTDIYGHLSAAGKKIVAVAAVAAQDVVGVNTRHQLAEVDAIMQQRIQRYHMENGVTLVSLGNAYIEDGATIGADTVIYPFSFIGRSARIGCNCTIGPAAHIAAGATVPDNTVIRGETWKKGA